MSKLYPIKCHNRKACGVANGHKKGTTCKSKPSAKVDTGFKSPLRSNVAQSASPSALLDGLMDGTISVDHLPMGFEYNEYNNDLKVRGASGKLHNEHGPAMLKDGGYTNGGTTIFMYEGKFHSYNDEPSKVSFQETTWHTHGKPDRLNGPALIEHSRGLFEPDREVWYRDGVPVEPTEEQLEAWENRNS